jgi:hypothetical protein
VKNIPATVKADSMRKGKIDLTLEDDDDEKEMSKETETPKSS